MKNLNYYRNKKKKKMLLMMNNLKFKNQKKE